jgi:hypothetical protein
MGTAPTHPELLDWLAADFIDHGWQPKRLHKMILMSSAYRMDSIHPRQAEYATRDFANEHWYRANRKRLEAEPLRDAMLAVGGRLNPQYGGPSFYPTATREALEGLSKKGADWKESSPEEQSRRSIYMFTKRSLLLPLMTVFDFADTTQPCAQRNVSTVAPQALALLNNDFVHAQSDAFATRLVRDIGADKGTQIQRAWWLALQRAPTDDERQFALEHLSQQRDRFASAGATSSDPDQLALASLCHVLLNLNEFIYVD